MKPIKQYQRMEFEGTPLYVRPDLPDWFVPTSLADAALHQYAANGACQEPLPAGLLKRLDAPAPQPYPGRGQVKALTSLKECWFHITNACNMRCSHCLFASGEENHASLDFDTLLSAVNQARELGCTIFYFTGGEPLIYPRFREICAQVLSDPAAHLVVLTNAKALASQKDWLAQQDRGRLHFQISIDGLAANHEQLRGPGSFRQLQADLQTLKELGFPVTLSMAVNRCNVHEMPALVEVAHGHGVENLHFMWLFHKGKADRALFVEPQEIFHHARIAYEKAEQHGISIDNFEIIKTQVFNLPGIKMDLNNACWESLAVGPDGLVYPSPSLVFESALACGHISEGLQQIWQHSPVMQKVRSASLADCAPLADNPLRFLTGGGDLDHSFIHAGTLVGHDPYLPLYERMTLYLISREAAAGADAARPALRARMGERVEECEEGGTTVAFTHSNCVLSLSGHDGHASIRSFYSQAAEEVNDDILNPVQYDRAMLEHIPEEACVRSYGCGSPVLDCGLQPGEYLVDLGSGTGVECFIASKQVGPQGRVFGIDMSDTMLARARTAQERVAENLGYANVAFKKGLLEQIPLPDGSIDAVISNCVINLAINKRRTFREIYRILKPGGRILISDIITSSEIPLEIKLNEKLRGECIGGAMHERDLFGMLEDFGFTAIRVVKRFFYREVKGYPFYSLTYQAFKPGTGVPHDLIYRGPFAGVVCDDGVILQRGQRASVALPPGVTPSDDFMVLDAYGQVTNLPQEMNCCCVPSSMGDGCISTSADVCCTPKLQIPEHSCVCPPPGTGHKSGCPVCGKRIKDLDQPKQLACHYCKTLVRVEHCCEDEHFVCDQCRIRAAEDAITTVCLQSSEKDVLALLQNIRSNPLFPTHGPHHHPMVPGILLTAYRNNGGKLSDDQILAGIARGAQVPGAACSFFGVDGAAIGVGIAVSIILGASPFDGQTRNTVQKTVIRVSQKIAEHAAARCCLREIWIALKEAAALSQELLPVPIIADQRLMCDQSDSTDYCSGNACPLRKQTS